MSQQREQIRSYAALFNKDWRVHTIPDGKGGKVRLGRNGVAMRSVGYFFSVLVVMVALAIIPPFSWLLAPLAFLVKFVGFPVAGAVLLTQLEPDGRSAALWVWSMVLHYVRGSYRSAGRRLRPPGAVWVVDAPTVVAASVRGPGLPGGVVRADGSGSVAFGEEMVVLPEGRSWLPRGLRRMAVARPVSAKLSSRARARGLVVTLEDTVELDPGDRLRIKP